MNLLADLGATWKGEIINQNLVNRGIWNAVLDKGIHFPFKESQQGLGYNT